MKYNAYTKGYIWVLFEHEVPSNLRYSTFDPKVYIITCFYSVLLITDYDFSAESQVLFCFVVQMATKKFFA